VVSITLLLDNTCNSMSRMIVHYQIRLPLMKQFKLIRKRRKEERTKRRKKRRMKKMVMDW